MKKLIIMAAISFVVMCSCKNRAHDDVNVMPGANVETVPDKRDIKASDSTKIIATDSSNTKVVN